MNMDPSSPLNPAGAPVSSQYGSSQIGFTNQPPPGQYVYNPHVQPGPYPDNTAALNARPRVYQPEPVFWSRSGEGHGYRYYGKPTLLGLAIFIGMTVLIITIFLVVFFTVISK